MSNADDEIAQGEIVPPSRAEALGGGMWELQIQQWQFQSPLPPPPVLREYEAMIPDFAERFMSAWETQSTHRQSLERTAVATQSMTQVRGQQFTLVLGIVALLVAAVLGIWASTAAAIAVVTMDFLSLGGVFVYARRSANEELRLKAQQVPEEPPSKPQKPKSQVGSAPVKSRNKKKRGRR